VHSLTPKTPPAPEDEWTPERHPSSLNLLVRTAGTYARRPAQLLSTARHSIPLLTRLPGVLTRLLPTGQDVEQESSGDVPHTVFNQQTDGRRNFEGRSYDLATVLEARTLVPGATVNDVVLTGIGGALRRYLLDKGELPESSLVTAMAIAVHADSDRHQHGANQIAVTRVPLGTNVADPVARLRVVHKSTAQSKASTEAVGPKIVEYAEFLPGTIFVSALRVGMAAHLGKYIDTARVANTYVTTMRGPEDSIYLVGARMIAGYAMSPFTQGNGLMHNVFTYAGRVFVSINGCPNVLPDIERYGDCMDASFADLPSR
jgi:diacylglycerol O-acyltransferase